MRCAGLASWSLAWGVGAGLGAYGLLRRVQPSGGRLRPTIVGAAAGIWAAGFRVQAFPVRFSSKEVVLRALFCQEFKYSIVSIVEQPHSMGDTRFFCRLGAISSDGW